MGKNERIARIDKKKNILRSWGLDESLVNKYKNETFKTLEDKKFKRNLKSKQLMLDKLDYLVKEGIKPESIKRTDLRKSWDFLRNEFIGNKVYYADDYLYIGWANRGESDLIIDMNEDLSISDIKELIESCIEESLLDIDDSGGFLGFPKIFWGSKYDCIKIENEYAKRGYNMELKKFVSDSFQSVCNRNDWTKREIAEIMLCIVSQTTCLKAVDTYLDFNHYVKENDLPFLDLFDETLLLDCEKGRVHDGKTKKGGKNIHT